MAGSTQQSTLVPLESALPGVCYHFSLTDCVDPPAAKHVWNMLKSSCHACSGEEEAKSHFEIGQTSAATVCIYHEADNRSRDLQSVPISMHVGIARDRFEPCLRRHAHHHHRLPAVQLYGHSRFPCLFVAHASPLAYSRLFDFRFQPHEPSARPPFDRGVSVATGNFEH